MRKTFKKDRLPKVDKMFAFNVGKKGIIFNDYHPYFFELPENIKELKSINYGLPLYSFGQ